MSGANFVKEAYFVHGEPNAATELAHKVRDKFSVECFVPEIGETVEI